MSNFSQAMDHAVLFHERGILYKVQYWTERALPYLHEEYEWPGHICMAPMLEEPAIALSCELCGEATTVNTVGAAMRFRDAHFYCRDEHAPHWNCERCGHIAFAHEDRCRFCWQDRPFAVLFHHNLTPEYVLNQSHNYAVRDKAGIWIASVVMPSLLLARRAARKTFRREQTRVCMVESLDPDLRLGWDTAND
jgi:hypothetical protein